MTARLLVPARKLGGYEVLLQLKTGGMGEVLLARRLGAGGFEKLVAIKTIRGEYRENQELRHMFLDEARLLARLNHPAIAQVHDFGDDGGELYLVMEYVEGVRFRRLTELGAPASVAAAAMAGVCRGLHAAHELADLAGHPLNVVHRDITPENLMLTYGGQVKVLDFGIALMRGRQAPMTELGTIKGKPPYLSPEQLRCEPLDRRTDVYSAGLVLHELVTGQPVFAGESVFAVARAIEHEDVAPPSAIAGPLPDGFDEAVLRAIRRDRDERYPDARAFADDLDRIVAAAGGPSLEDYAATALAGDRDRHRGWLQSVLAADGDVPGGRPSGVMTAAAADAEIAPSSAPAAPAALPPEAAPTVLTDGARRSGGARVFAAIAVVLVAALGIGLLAIYRGGGGTAAMATGDPDGAPVIAQVDPADAALAAVTPPSVDAAVATPVEPRRGDDRRDRPPRDRKPRDREPADPPPADPPPADPPPAAGFGKITVAAEPYALVRIDGTEIGATPIFGRKIAAGEHEVVLASPDTGKVRLRRTVVVEPDEHEQVILK